MHITQHVIVWLSSKYFHYFFSREVGLGYDKNETLTLITKETMAYLAISYICYIT